MLFNKGRLMPESGFFFTLPHLIYITHSLYHNKITHLLILDIPSNLQAHITAMLSSVLVKIENWAHTRLYPQ